jgi:hypothetical protein
MDFRGTRWRCRTRRKKEKKQHTLHQPSQASAEAAVQSVQFQAGFILSIPYVFVVAVYVFCQARPKSSSPLASPRVK